MWELWNGDHKILEGEGLIEGIVELWRAHLSGSLGAELVADENPYGVPRFGIAKMQPEMKDHLNKWLHRGGDLRILAQEYLTNCGTNQRHATELIFIRMANDEEWPPLPPQELLSADQRLRAVCQRCVAVSWVHVEDATTGSLHFQKVRVHDPEVEIVRFITPSRLLLRYPVKSAKGTALRSTDRVETLDADPVLRESPQSTFSILSLDPLTNQAVQTPFVLQDPQPDLIGRIIIWILVTFLALLFTAGAIERLQRGHAGIALSFLLFAVIWIVGAWIWQTATWIQTYDLAKGIVADTWRCRRYTRHREFLFTDFDSVTESEAYYKGRKFKATVLRGAKGRMNVIGAPDPKWIADRLGVPVKPK